MGQQKKKKVTKDLLEKAIGGKGKPAPPSKTPATDFFTKKDDPVSEFRKKFRGKGPLVGPRTKG